MTVRLVSQEELDGPLRGYKLLERLGRGGFGEVWKVEAPGGLHKAMKFVFGDLDSAEEEGRPAEQELKALHRVKTIRHPYILSLERFDIIDGQLIIVMELADRNLWDRFRECRTQGLMGIPREELLRYMEESAEALDLMNDTFQIQHLDIKPQNLFLVHKHVKVADFGLAKAFEGIRATMTGGVTPVYAAPETFEGNVSRFCDQYSLAIVFQELLTGTRPFTGANTKQLLLQHLNGAPEMSALSDADKAVVARGLAKNPEERWPTCAQMVEALREAGSHPARSTVPSGSQSIDQTSRTRPEVPRAAPTYPPPPPTSPTMRPKDPLTMRSPTARPGGGLFPPGGSGTFSAPGFSPGITPRLVTPSAAAGSGATPALTLQRPQVFQTARMSSLGIAPPEKTGDGVLFPALVVGVGSTGLAVLKAFKAMVRERFGTAEAVPNVRLLYIDTDPDVTAAATQGPDGLLPRDVVLTRLNRPAHYLQGSTIPNVEQWLPSGILYKLPKNVGPAGGVRAFGRLALCDNYRLVAQRVRQEIEPFLSDESLDKAGEATGLGVASNRPRAYVVAGLAGGTGSGMALDLGYILKHELRSVGYRKPDVVGVCLVPPADKAVTTPAALANTFAALAELSHFGSGAKYQTRFDNNEQPIADPDGPFGRTVVVQLPKATKERETARVVGQAARGVFLEALSPTGRASEAIRAAAAQIAPGTAPVAEVFGVSRLAWPRRDLLETATRRFGQRLLLRWAAKDAPHLKEPVKAWLDQQWTKQKLDLPTAEQRFDQAVRDALQEPAEAVFDAAVDTLRTRTPAAGRLDPATVIEVTDQLLLLVGKPAIESDIPGKLTGVIGDAGKKFASEAEASLAVIAVSFLEQPQYRVAGSEEVIAQVRERLTNEVNALEAAKAAQFREATEVYAKLLGVVGSLSSGGARKAAVAEIGELIRSYPTKRLRAVRTDAILSLYRGMLLSLPEYSREVNMCRTRLGELATLVAGNAGTTRPPGAGVAILPAGCDTIDAAAEQFLAAITPDDLLAFDQTVQKDTLKKFRGIVSVCLKPEKSPDFAALLTDHARTFLAEKLEHADPAEMLLRYRGDGPDTLAVFAKAYADAAPHLPDDSIPVIEGAILAVPESEAGDRIRALAAEACPDADFIPAPSSEDIVLLRGRPRVALTDLPHLGPAARDAYEAQSRSELPPHTRTDVAWQVPVGQQVG